jgi:hypothetical protein
MSQFRGDYTSLARAVDIPSDVALALGSCRPSLVPRRALSEQESKQVLELVAILLETLDGLQERCRALDARLDELEKVGKGILTQVETCRHILLTGVDPDDA